MQSRNRSSSTTSIKVVVVGESGVGKTSLIQQFVNHRFNQEFKPTIGTDFTQKIMTLSPSEIVDSGNSSSSATRTSTTVLLQIWDTAGQERFRSLSTTYFRGCEVALIVFDVTDEASFERLQFWIDEVKLHCGSTNDSGVDSLPFIVLGNKADSTNDRQVAQRRAAEVCKGRKMAYVETSAKFGDNVEQAFKSAAAAAMQIRSAASPVAAGGTLRAGSAGGPGKNTQSLQRGPSSEQKKSGGCC